LCCPGPHSQQSSTNGRCAPKGALMIATANSASAFILLFIHFPSLFVEFFIFLLISRSRSSLLSQWPISMSPSISSHLCVSDTKLLSSGNTPQYSVMLFLQSRPVVCKPSRLSLSPHNESANRMDSTLLTVTYEDRPRPPRWLDVKRTTKITCLLRYNYDSAAAHYERHRRVCGTADVT